MINSTVWILRLARRMTKRARSGKTTSKTLDNLRAGGAEFLEISNQRQRGGVCKTWK